MKLLLILGEFLIFVVIFCEMFAYMCPYMQRDSYNKSMDTEFSEENEALMNVHNLVFTLSSAKERDATENIIAL